MRKIMMINPRTNYIIITALVSILWFAMSCNDSHNHNTQESPSSINHAEHSSDVMLDNNQKWIANAETTQGIDNMMNIVKDEKSMAKIDCKQVQSKLNKEFEEILQKCTMKGEAHNQLHNYLMPLSTHIESLDIDDNNECLATINIIESYLADYSDYFE